MERYFSAIHFPDFSNASLKHIIITFSASCYLW